MALTITIQQLSAAVRLTATESVPPEPMGTILARQMGVAEAIIEEYVDADTPDDVKNEAAVLIVGYLFEAPVASRTPQSAFTHSTAKALLSGWHEPQAADPIFSGATLG